MNRKLAKTVLAALLFALSISFEGCKDEENDTAVSDTIVSDTTAPATVTDLNAEAKDSRVLLTWTDADDEDIYGYEVSYTGKGAINRSAAALEKNTLVVPQGAGGTYVSGLTNGTSYAFTVKSVDTSGNKSEGVTAEATPAEGATLKIDFSVQPPQQKDGEQIATVKVKIDTTSTVKRVVYKKDGSPIAKTLLADTEASPATETDDNSVWNLEIKGTASASNGTYTVAAIDESGREEAEAVKIDSFVDVPEGFVIVYGATVSGQVADSLVFVEGRTVEIPNLLVCDHEVTQAEYLTYCTDSFHGEANQMSEHYGRGDDFPAYYVSWTEAAVYCNLRSIAENLTPAYSRNGETDPSKWKDSYKSVILKSKEVGGITKYGLTDYNGYDRISLTCDWTANGYRLPTECEWEYVARGGNGGIPEKQYIYSGSDTIDEVAWYSTITAHKVKTKKANSLGIYDMSGNVMEMCWDSYEGEGWPITKDTPATGTERGGYTLARGGNFVLPWYDCTVSCRRYSSYTGLRVVRTAQ